jgi:hypothetical protein
MARECGYFAWPLPLGFFASSALQFVGDAWTFPVDARRWLLDKGRWAFWQ